MTEADAAWVAPRRLTALLRTAFVVLGPSRRSAWVWLVLLGAVASTIEAVAGLLIFTLLSVVTDPSRIQTLPIAADLGRRYGLSDNALLLLLGSTVALFFLLRGVLLQFQIYVTNRASFRAGADLSVRLLRGYLSKPYTWHLGRNSSELIRNAHESAVLVSTTMFLGVISMAGEAMVVFALVSVIFLKTPFPALIAAVATAGLAFGLQAVLRPRFAAFGQQVQDFGALSLRSLQNALYGIREVKILGREDVFTEQFRQTRLPLARAQSLQQTLNALPRLVLDTVMVAAVVVVLVVSVVTSGSSAQTLASVSLVAYAALRILPAVNRILTYVNNVEFGRAALTTIASDLADVPSQRAYSALPPSPLPFRESLALADVSFAYPGSTVSVLEGIDLSISRGEAVGVVGRTGSGKSTLADLLLALVEPTAGKLLVDGQPVGDPRAWQQRTGVVSQAVFLLDDTMRRNIAFGVPDEEIDEDAVAAALRLAALQEVVDALPDGLETRLGERGTRLSGGQRQRVAIARAVYNKPDFLVLDEGTSALDAETERQVVEAVGRLRGATTVLLIAHRLSTLASCDRVLELEGGCVVRSGSYETLLSPSSGGDVAG